MNYACPYCGRLSTLTSVSHDEGAVSVDIAKSLLSYGHYVGLTYTVLVCPNTECKRISLGVSLNKFIGAFASGTSATSEVVQAWSLLPESNAKPQPDYIPQPIVEDYTEASRIANLSPKAAATLARRCMQGMIRDFHGINRPKLYQEVDALKGKIPDAQYQAMDALRSVGNIGAHMEADVNKIIDIDKGEVTKLLAFIEYLFEQWYVKRHDDEQALKAIVDIAGIKVTKKGTSQVIVSPEADQNDVKAKTN